ncbi:MAG: DUF429 domain-containing protein [Candidatus Acidiferrum sp.]
MFAGVDACKGGWLVAKSMAWPCKMPPVLAICPDFSTVIALTMDCKKVAVDIPIGLSRGKQVRKCDLEAKKMLSGHNTSALFYAPPREALSAETPQDFQRLHRLARGVGAGLPVWGFLKKVREANAVMTAELQKRIVEFHPELTWFRLAGESLETKHSPEGIADRKKVLRKFVPELERVLRWKDFLGRAAALDDLLDALAGIAVAKDALRGTLCRLPDKVREMDATGLRMEIWY